MMSMPHSSGSSAFSSSTRRASPPLNSFVNMRWKFSFACAKVVRNISLDFVFRLVMSARIFSRAARRSASCSFSRV